MTVLDFNHVCTCNDCNRDDWIDQCRFAGAMSKTPENLRRLALVVRPLTEGEYGRCMQIANAVLNELGEMAK